MFKYDELLYENEIIKSECPRCGNKHNLFIFKINKYSNTYKLNYIKNMIYCSYCNKEFTDAFVDRMNKREKDNQYILQVQGLDKNDIIKYVLKNNINFEQFANMCNIEWSRLMTIMENKDFPTKDEVISIKLILDKTHYE